jgi:hypothetical protein
MRALLLAPLMAVALPIAASAADLPVPTQPTVVTPALAPEWEFSIAPYFWAAGLDGEIGLFGLPDVEVDESFKDIMETFDFGAMAVTEIRHGRFGVFTDLMYAKTSDAAATPLGILADKVKLESQVLTVTAMGEYRFVDDPRFSFDVMAGGRLWWVDNEISFRGGPLDGVSGDDGDTWVDPMIGAKGRFNITPKIFVNGWGMVGGFGAASDFGWDVLGAVGYQFTDRFSTAIGYRALGVDYENDGFKYDVIQHGPIAGMIIRF